MEQERLQVMLAAYVLGEATPAEIAEVERALENSEDLCRERARLEATIGLVQTHLPADGDVPGLSPEASAALERAAEQRATPPPNLRWYQRPSLRIAASVMFAGLVWAGYQATIEPDDTSAFIYHTFGGDGEAVALAPAVREPHDRGRSLEYLAKGASKPKERSKAERQEALRLLGYIDDSSMRHGDETPEAKDDLEEWPIRIDSGDELRGLAYLGRQVASRRPPTGEVENAKVSQEELEALKSLGYVDNVNDGTDAPATPPDIAHVARTASPPDGQITGSGEFFLGQGDLGNSPAERKKFNRSQFTRQGSRIQSTNPMRWPESSGVHGAGRREGLIALGVKAEAEQALEAMGYFDDADDREQMRALGYFGDFEEMIDELMSGSHRQQQLAQRLRVERTLEGIETRPNEGPGAMFFRFWGDNPFEYTVLDHLSTFSIDVDTASYTLARKYLIDGHLPTKAQVRTEEFVNYFDADVPAPTEKTFGIHTELAPSRFAADPRAWMLRVVVAGKEVTRNERQPLTLTFVVDTSGSMASDNRIGLVKRSLGLLTDELDARDSISIVTFSNEARLVLPMTSASRRALIDDAIRELGGNGGTNAGAGLILGYRQAEANLAAGTTNRVVLLSDGVANVGDTSQQSLTRRVERSRKQGIYLNTIGVGMGNHNDALLEQLADKGDGICNYIDDEAEARRALVENFTGAFEPIARDVKIQVEFDPAQIESYRLLGYENRAVADKDFRNDKVDAGEINAGHQVVALYELIRTERPSESPLATVRLRWKRPYTEGVASAGDEVATEGYALVRASDAAGSFRATSPGYRKSVLVAQFAEFLRHSIHAREDSVDELIAEVGALSKELRGDVEFEEFGSLVVRNRVLVVKRLMEYGRLGRALDSLRRSAYLAEEMRMLEDRLESFGKPHSGTKAEIEAYVERVRWIRGVMDRLDESLDDATLLEMQSESDLLSGRITRLLEQIAEARRR